MASTAFRRPLRSLSRATSIIMMAFFFTMPISKTTPMRAITVRSVRVTSRARIAPIPAEGRVERIVSGWT